MTVHYFNPETDYALACGMNVYNLPAKIKELKRRLMLLPAMYASPGDIISVDSVPSGGFDSVQYYPLVEEKGLSLIDFRELPDVFAKYEDVEFRPWGWNHSLLHDLLAAGVPENRIKRKEEVETIRDLSHRRTAIEFNHILANLLPDVEENLPAEIFSMEMAKEVLDNEEDVFFKLPWSSSGRGVVRTSDMSCDKLLEWVSGGIAKQGSVIVERAFPKSADFATEWWCRDGQCEFIGVSLFRASASGKYLGNVDASQSELADLIKGYAPPFGDRIIAAQKEALDRIISPYYSGPLGIDMLATDEGKIVPCIEINLRMTMGHAYIKK